MDNLPALVVLLVFLYCIGALSKKNEKRMEKYAQKLLKLFGIDQKQNGNETKN